MHKKISVGAAVTIALITLAVTAIITTAVTMNVYSGLVADLPAREEMYDSLAEVDDIVRTNYLGDAESETALNGITDGYVSSLSTGVNYIMTADEYAVYKNKLEGFDENGSQTETVKYKLFGSAGYIKITDFINTTPDEFKSAYDALSENSVSALIIDVRNTDSMNIDCAAEIIDMIVPLTADSSQAIATAVDKNGKSVKIFPADSNSINLPVSVIVNENTKGAGELLACDIRDFGKGAVAGKATAGDGTYQQVFELSDGGAVVLTTAKLMPYKSDNYDGVGVAPDYDVALDRQTDDLNEDSQFLQGYAAVLAAQR